MTDNTSHMFLSTDADRKRVFETSAPDANKNYLIFLCEQLQKKSNDLEKDNTNMRKDMADMEEENDGYDERIRYMRGKLHNFVELTKLYKEILVKLNKNSDNLTTQVDKSSKMINNMLIYTLIDTKLKLLNFCVLWYMDKFTLTNMLISYFGSSFACYTFFSSIPITFSNYFNELRTHKTDICQLESDIKKIASEIKGIDDANDYLNEYIDIV